MSGLKTVVELISKLTPEEKDIAEKYLNSFHRRGENTETVKLISLWETVNNHITANEPIIDSSIKFIVYGGDKVLAFGKLVIRLRDKILESLLLDINIHREKKYAERWKVMTDTRKRINVALILRSRGLSELAFYLLKISVSSAKEYELYDELLQAQKQLIVSYSMKFGKDGLRKQLDLYDHYMMCKQAADQAQFAYTELSVHIDFSAHPNDAINWLEQKIKEINKKYKATKSATVGYWLKYLEIHYYQILSNKGRMKRSLIELFQLLKENDSIKTKDRLGICLLNLSECELYEYNFEFAERNIVEALKLFDNDGFNSMQATELLAITYFYQGKFEGAENVISGLLKADKEVSGELRHGKRKYILGCIFFMQRKFDEAHQVFSELNPIEKDDEGWNIWIRIMNVLAMSERLLHDSAAAGIKNLFYHVDKLSKEKEYPDERTKLIVNILQKLSRQGFQFSSTYQLIKEQVDLLESGNYPYKWMPTSPEVLPFHQWLKAKTFQQPIFPFTKKIVDRKTPRYLSAKA